MKLKTVSWIMFFVIAFALVGCGTTDSKKQLKSPSVYKDPKVQITHAPTEVPTVGPTLAADVTASPDQNTSDLPVVEPTEDETALLDDLDNLLTDIENKLLQMNPNP